MSILIISLKIDFNNLSLCDVGAGAGFPSIPLKICFPDMKLTIIDPLQKRMEFYNYQACNNILINLEIY